MRYLFWLILLLLLSVGTLRVTGCGEESLCGDCSTTNPCTAPECVYDPEDPDFDFDFSLCQPSEDEDPADYRCAYYRKPDGSPCGGGNVCVKGACTEGDN
jgi:hypothetical protein